MFTQSGADPSSRPRLPRTFRFAPYALAVSLIMLLYVAALAVMFFIGGGLDPAAYETAPTPWHVTRLIGLIMIPPVAIAVVFGILSVVVLHRRGRRLHWAVEAVVAAVAGLALAVTCTVLVLLVVWALN